MCYNKNIYDRTFNIDISLLDKYIFTGLGRLKVKTTWKQKTLHWLTGHVWLYQLSWKVAERCSCCPQNNEPSEAHLPHPGNQTTAVFEPVTAGWSACAIFNPNDSMLMLFYQLSMQRIYYLISTIRCHHKRKNVFYTVEASMDVKILSLCCISLKGIICLF